MNYIELLKRVTPRGVHSHLGGVRRWLRTLPARTRRQKQRLLDDPALKAKERELLEQVETRISAADSMYSGDGAHYYKVGLSAVRSIEEAVEAAQLGSVNRILDLPCGHGRVLRFLLQCWPKTKFTACDLDLDGVEFCAQVFGAEPAYSQKDLRTLSLMKEFDLIWCGSLITHLDDRKIAALLDFFQRHLSPGGLVVFTAAGDRVVKRMLSGEFDYGIDLEKIPLITGTYHEGGYGYTDYSYNSDYGISLTSPDWIRAEVQKIHGLREVYFEPQGWDNHQDVYGFVRQPEQ